MSPAAILEILDSNTLKARATEAGKDGAAKPATKTTVKSAAATKTKSKATPKTAAKSTTKATVSR